MFKSGKALYLFILYLLILLVGRGLVYYFLNMHYLDNDQPMMWIGARDYSLGQFHEPRFYGQNYNTLLEGLFAVPLLLMGMKVYYAVPLVTHLMFLFPFVFGALYLFKIKKTLAAFLFPALLMCMPTEFDMVSSLPRGFVTGVFFCSFFVVSLHKPKNILWLHINCFLAVAGYFVNQSSVLLSLPFAVYLFLNNYREKKFYWSVLTALASALLMYFLLDWYYVKEPANTMMGMRVVFSPENLFASLKHLDEKFVHVSFFACGKSFTLLVVLALLLFLSYRQDRRAFTALLSFIAMVLFSFLFTKNIEGTTWPFFSLSRNYISFPLILALFASLLNFEFRFVGWLYLIPLIYASFKLPNTKANIEKHIGDDKNYYVSVYKLDYALDAIEVYENLCRKNKASRFIVSNRFWLCSVLVYGGPACDPEFPFTLMGERDRRLWLMKEEKDKVYDKFVFLSCQSDFDKNVQNADSAFHLKKLDEFGLFLVDQNKLKTSEFMERMKFAETGEGIQ